MLNASEERLLLEVHNLRNLKKAILIALPLSYEDNNKTVLQVAMKHRELFLPVGAVLKEDLKSIDSLQRRIRSLKRDGFIGIKIHPRLLGISLEDEIIKTAVMLSMENEMVSFICTVYRFPSPPMKMPLYCALYDIAYRCYPSKIVFLHGGYYDLLRLLEVCGAMDNVLFDLSCTLSRFELSSLSVDVEYIFKKWSSKVCLGSDFPEGTPKNAFSKAVNLIGRDIEKLKAILYDNVISFMGVDRKEGEVKGEQEG